VTLPKIVQETLPNGLRLVVIEDRKQPALWLRLALPAGSIRDPKDKIGLATMVAAQLDQQTTTRSESQIADLIDGLGASLGASANDDYLNISANGLSLYADTLFDLLADITLNPTFPEEEANRYKSRTISNIKSSLAEGGTLADLALARLVYGEHPYGNYALGAESTIPTITSADLKKFHATYFAPNVATLFVVGDITPAQARQQSERVFGKWAKKDIPVVPEPPKLMAGGTGDGKPKIVIVDRPGAQQTEIRIGQLTPGYKDPSRIAGTVSTILLGGGGFDNRLMKEIRVKRGLTYGANSQIDRNRDAGLFSIFTFTKNASTGETLKVALEEVKKLQETPPTSDELLGRKQFLTGFVNVSTATPDGVLGRLIPAILNGDGITDLTTFAERVTAVTPADVQKTFQSLPLAATYIVLVGEAKEVEPQVKDLGNVTIIPTGELDLLSANLRGSAKPTTPTVAATPEAAKAGKALLDATVKAHGGESFLKIKAFSLKGTGRLTTPPEQGGIEISIESATVTSALPGRVRFDLKTGFGDIVVGSPGDGKPTWIQLSEQVQEQPDQDQSGAGDPVVLVLKAVQNNWPVAAIPETLTTADNKKLKGFTVTNEKGKSARIFVEEDTALVRRVEFPTAMGMQAFELSEYKKLEGDVMMPTKFRQIVNNQELFSLTFTEFNLAPNITDALFQKP
jgi:zinc protease